MLAMMPRGLEWAGGGSGVGVGEAHAGGRHLTVVHADCVGVQKALLLLPLLLRLLTLLQCLLALLRLLPRLLRGLLTLLPMLRRLLLPGSEVEHSIHTAWLCRGRCHRQLSADVPHQLAPVQRQVAGGLRAAGLCAARQALWVPRCRSTARNCCQLVAWGRWLPSWGTSSGCT